MPCLDEAETLATCIEKARTFFADADIDAEIIVADNGSTDGSRETALDRGARVIDVKSKGYGSALAGGIGAARGRYVIMGDADDTYDFSRLGPFVEKLREGYDLVMGNRFRGGIGKDAMPFLHRYLGNPLLTRIGRIFFESRCGDFYCGLRGFSRAAYDVMGPVMTGMEFALEMNAKAAMFDLSVTEVPTILSTSARTRKPHLKTWSDGWRSLKFFLVYSPRWLFVYPGLALMALGLLFGAGFLFVPALTEQGNAAMGSLLASAVCATFGFQSVIFGVFGKIGAMRLGLHPRKIGSRLVRRILESHSLERGAIAGLTLIVWGTAFLVIQFLNWHAYGPAGLAAAFPDRLRTLCVLALPLGAQMALASFYWSLLMDIPQRTQGRGVSLRSWPVPS